MVVQLFRPIQRLTHIKAGDIQASGKHTSQIMLNVALLIGFESLFCGFCRNEDGM